MARFGLGCQGGLVVWMICFEWLGWSKTQNFEKKLKNSNK